MGPNPTVAEQIIDAEHRLARTDCDDCKDIINDQIDRLRGHDEHVLRRRPVAGPVPTGVFRHLW